MPPPLFFPPAVTFKSDYLPSFLTSGVWESKRTGMKTGFALASELIKWHVYFSAQHYLVGW